MDRTISMSASLPSGYSHLVVDGLLARGGDPAPGVLLYDAGSGAARLCARRGGAWAAAPLEGLKPGWTSVAIGAFRAAGQADLFLYNKATGAAALYALDEHGRLQAISSEQRDPGWTHVVPARIRADGRLDLIFYAAGSISVTSATPGWPCSRTSRGPRTPVRPTYWRCGCRAWRRTRSCSTPRPRAAPPCARASWGA